MRNPQDILTGMQDEEWQSFLSTTYPMLQNQAKKLNTLSTDYYNNAMKNANTVIAMQQGDRDTQREALGATLTGQDAVGQDRYDSLSATTALNSGANKSVDEANTVKQSIAADLLGVQTTLKNQALNDASSASGMASSRQQQGINSKAQNKANTMGALGTVASIGAVMF